MVLDDFVTISNKSRLACLSYLYKFPHHDTISQLQAFLFMSPMSVARPPETRNSTSQVFDILDLVDLICDFLGQKHCGSLMRTSRRFFRSTLTVVWREVDIESLLFLIPGTSLGSLCGGYKFFSFGPAGHALGKKVSMTPKLVNYYSTKAEWSIPRSTGVESVWYLFSFC